MHIKKEQNCDCTVAFPPKMLLALLFCSHLEINLNKYVLTRNKGSTLHMKKEQNCDCTVAFLPKMLRKQHFGGESHCTITILFFFHVQSGARLYNNYAANSVTQDKYSSEEEFKKAVAEIHKHTSVFFKESDGIVFIL